jgi:hypothetical protein
VKSAGLQITLGPTAQRSLHLAGRHVPREAAATRGIKPIFTAALHFAQAEWEQIVQRLHGWVGRKDRNTVEIDATVYRVDGSKRPVVLTDFTDEGCRIEAEDEFLIGERLQIAIPRMGQVKAQIRWALQGSAGAQFVVESDF